MTALQKDTDTDSERRRSCLLCSYGNKKGNQKKTQPSTVKLIYSKDQKNPNNEPQMFLHNVIWFPQSQYKLQDITEFWWDARGMPSFSHFPENHVRLTLENHPGYPKFIPFTCQKSLADNVNKYLSEFFIMERDKWSSLGLHDLPSSEF